MHTRFRLSKSSQYPWLFAVLVLTAMGFLFLSAPTSKAIELALPATGAIAGFVYFLYSQHLQETRLFTGLFKDFNGRYKALNDRLNAIVSRDGQVILCHDNKQTLIEYFILCAEEYLYYKAGYIDDDVWRAWVNGMADFARDREIRRFWAEELRGESYYGFSLSLLPTKVSETVHELARVPGGPGHNPTHIGVVDRTAL
jgi:hypothetical protein